MKNTIPTAEEFYQSAINDNSIGDDITDLMDAYAKICVEAALKQQKESFESSQKYYERRNDNKEK
jgi:hypothetical protein